MTAGCQVLMMQVLLSQHSGADWRAQMLRNSMDLLARCFPEESWDTNQEKKRKVSGL